MTFMFVVMPNVYGFMYPQKKFKVSKNKPYPTCLNCEVHLPLPIIFMKTKKNL